MTKDELATKILNAPLEARVSILFEGGEDIGPISELQDIVREWKEQKVPKKKWVPTEI